VRLAVSNLAWGDRPWIDVIDALTDAALDGVEIAPTAIWPQAPAVTRQHLQSFADSCTDAGLAVSGIQSLLYGHPELQLFDRSTWPSLHQQLAAMIGVAQALDAPVMVFGSPRNRVRGDLPAHLAIEMAAEFFAGLVPDLAEAGVTLTLEPNAPAYGADFMTTYDEATAMALRIDSPSVQPQIDTGCLAMVGEDSSDAVRRHRPAHVHVSAPRLGPPPADVDHAALARELRAINYSGWVVLEMLPPPGGFGQMIDVIEWFAATYGSGVDG
jgi:D-psicose/D-tagatose/L-ribulose 3-epimerase